VWTFNALQAETWIATLLWPFLRVLALMSSAPLLSHRAVPARAKIGLALLVAVLLAAGLPSAPTAPLFSAASLMLLAQQVLVGLALGLSMRIAFAAVELAGDLIGLQMGLGFATFFDPQTSAQTPIVGGLLSVASMLVFLSLDGPLLMLAGLADSFELAPVGADFYASLRWDRVSLLGAEMFALGLQLALPLLTTMLLCNIALGVMARAAPQLNLFSVGFPVTLLTGLALLALSAPYWLTPIESALRAGLAAWR
jgi:flagellar biosynthetic protein FliR